MVYNYIRKRASEIDLHKLLKQGYILIDGFKDYRDCDRKMPGCSKCCETCHGYIVTIKLPDNRPFRVYTHLIEAYQTSKERFREALQEIPWNNIMTNDKGVYYICNDMILSCTIGTPPTILFPNGNKLEFK